MVENSRTDPELSCPGASIAVGSDLLRNSTQQRTAAAGDLKSSVFFSGIKKTHHGPGWIGESQLGNWRQHSLPSWLVSNIISTSIISDLTQKKNMELSWTISQ